MWMWSCQGQIRPTMTKRSGIQTVIKFLNRFYVRDSGSIIEGGEKGAAMLTKRKGRREKGKTCGMESGKFKAKKE